MDCKKRHRYYRDHRECRNRDAQDWARPARRRGFSSRRSRIASQRNGGAAFAAAGQMLHDARAFLREQRVLRKRAQHVRIEMRIHPKRWQPVAERIGVQRLQSTSVLN
jgi:hypothetical protein